MFSQFKIIVILILVGAVMLAGAFHFGKYKQRQQHEIQQLRDDIRSERERVKDDAKTRNLSDYDFCIQSLHRRGLQSSDCEQLRGMAQE